MTSVHFIYASTSGNTEHVIHTVMHMLRTVRPDLHLESQRAEQALPEDLLRGDIVILGSGTWNTGGNEGQLNMHMNTFLQEKSRDINLQGKPMTFVSLGDERYYFRTRCTEHFLRFQREHNGTLFTPPLILVNEPYGQEEKILQWAEKLTKKMAADAPAATAPGSPASL